MRKRKSLYSVGLVSPAGRYHASIGTAAGRTDRVYDAVMLIQQYNHPECAVYCEPPYVLGSRTGKQYKHEMSDADHERLLQVLLQHKGPVLISGYDNEIYRDMLQGWHLKTQMEYCRANKRRTECLWMNFEPEGQIEMCLSDKK